MDTISDTPAADGRHGFRDRHPRTTLAIAITAATLLLFVAFLLFFNWNWVKGPISRSVSAALDREFRIDGDLGIRWGFSPTVYAEDGHLANASWSRDPEMASFERAEVRVRILPLLSGRVVIAYLDARKPHVIIERNAEGLGNWVFGEPKKAEPTKDDGPARVVIRDVRIEAGRLQFREPTLRTELALQIDSVKPDKAGDASPLALKGEGTYRGGPFSLAGRVDSPLELQGKPQPYRIDLTARAGETEAQVNGRLLEPLQVEDVEVDFRMKGANLGALYDLVGITLPETPPYELKGKLARHGQVVSYNDFTGRVGDSDLAGDASFDLGRERPLIKAKLKSKLLDYIYATVVFSDADVDCKSSYSSEESYYIYLFVT